MRPVLSTTAGEPTILQSVFIPSMD